MNDPESIAKFEHHLEHCQACYSRTELESALGELIRKSAKGKAPEKLQNRLRKLIDGI
jgi:anti-sigma factor (TIGR02949 family)